MSLRESKKSQKKQPAAEEDPEHTSESMTSTEVASSPGPFGGGPGDEAMTEAEHPEQDLGDTSTKIDEGSVQERLRRGIRDGDNDDPVLREVAEFLEETEPKLSSQKWYSLLQSVRDCSNRHEDLDQILNEISTQGATATPPAVRGGFCKMLQCLCKSLLVAVLILLAFSVALKVNDVNLGSFDIHNFFMLDPESARQWERLNRNSIRILVTGKTGTGKSALINGLIGDDVAQEGDTLDPTTSEVQEIKQMVHGISLSIFDSPGLQDGTSREDEYLQDMQRKCEKVDLVLYTIKMTDQRINVEDTDAMGKLTEAFGYDFWKKAMFVMTFANELRSPEYPEDKHENRKFFEERLQLWKDSLPLYVEQRSNIPISIGKEMPVVPAGYYKIRDLPGRKFWFSQFWKSALDRMMESSAEGAGYMLQFSQDRLKNYNDTTEEDFQKPIHEQPILSKIIDE